MHGRGGSAVHTALPKLRGRGLSEGARHQTLGSAARAHGSGRLLMGHAATLKGACRAKTARAPPPHPPCSANALHTRTPRHVKPASAPVLAPARPGVRAQLYRFAQMEGRWHSLSGLDRRVCTLFFYWSVWTVFLARRPPPLLHAQQHACCMPCLLPHGRCAAAPSLLASRGRTRTSGPAGGRRAPCWAAARSASWAR
jgi:hypothetical protein